MTDGEVQQLERFQEHLLDKGRKWLIGAVAVVVLTYGGSALTGIWLAATWTSDIDHRVERLEDQLKANSEQSKEINRMSGQIAVLSSQVDNLSKQVGTLALANDRLISLWLEDRRKP